MTKILFVFAGTGDTAKKNSEKYELDNYDDDVVRIYFNGCQDKVVGGSRVFGQLSPNLDIAGENVRSCFDKDGQLDIDALKKKFGNSVIVHPTEVKSIISVESINLMGFSRGAVTTFSAARHLDNLGKPIHIFAQDPVPGETRDKAQKKGTEFSKNHDLSHHKNIKKAQIVIGGYCSDINMIHDIFLRQMSPKFSTECDSHTYSVPKKHHLSACGSSNNQGMRFLMETGYLVGGNDFEEKKDALFFIPRVISQKCHAHDQIRFELLPRYREKLGASLCVDYENLASFDDQTLQALFALQQFDTTSPAKDKLTQAVLNGRCPRGDALRDSIIEFENMIQYVFRKSDVAKKDSLAVNTVREAVYQQLLDFPISPTPEDRDKFIKNLNENIHRIKFKLTPKEFKEFKKLAELFVVDTALLHINYKVLPQESKAGSISDTPAIEEVVDDVIKQQKDFKKNFRQMTNERGDDPKFTAITPSMGGKP